MGCWVGWDVLLGRVRQQLYTLNVVIFKKKCDTLTHTKKVHLLC